MLFSRLLTRATRPFGLLPQPSRTVADSMWATRKDGPDQPSKWLKLNEKVFEPTPEGEPKRPAYVCHEKRDIRYSFKKLYIVSCLVRGLSVDEALKQLNFVASKGARFVKDTILEAQELAVKSHNVEFKSNLWVAESFPEKSTPVPGYRRHARGMVHGVQIPYCHYLLRLEEGTPPKVYYYHRRRETPQELLDKWLEELRQRKVNFSL